MKSPLKKSIGEVVTDYGTKVMRILKKRLQRSLFDFYGDVKADNLRTRETINAPTTPVDGDGGIIYTKAADGKLYYKSNEVAEVELSAADTVLTSEQVQDIVGAMFTSNTETRISATYENSDGTIDLVVDAIPVDLTVDGSGTIHANNVPTLNQNTSGTAAGLSSTLAVGSGGTGSTTFTSNYILRGNGTSALTADANLRFDGSIFVVNSSTSARPAVYISNTNTDAEAPSLILDRTSTAGADGDDIGKIRFDAEDDSGGGPHTYAQMLGEIVTAANGSVGGKLTLSIASHDGELVQAISMTDGNAEDEVDVTIGSGSSSLTTIAGDLQINGNDIKDDDGTTCITFDSSGKTSIAKKLTVGSSQDEVLELNTTSATGNPFISFRQNGTRKSFIQHNDTSDTLKIASEFGAISLLTDSGGSETERLGIDSSGAVTIPTGNLTVSNHATVSKTLTVGGAGTTPAVSIRTAKITLTTADCNSLHTTPVQLVAAAGPDTVIVPTGGMVRVDRAATQTSSSPTVAFHYADQEPGTLGQSQVAHFRRFMYNESGDRVYHIIPSLVYNEVSQNLTDDVNKALEISSSSAFTTNCFTSITIYLTYHVIDIS